MTSSGADVAADIRLAVFEETRRVLAERPRHSTRCPLHDTPIITPCHCQQGVHAALPQVPPEVHGQDGAVELRETCNTNPVTGGAR